MTDEPKAMPEQPKVWWFDWLARHEDKIGVTIAKLALLAGGLIAVVLLVSALSVIFPALHMTIEQAAAAAHDQVRLVKLREVLVISLVWVVFRFLIKIFDKFDAERRAAKTDGGEA